MIGLRIYLIAFFIMFAIYTLFVGSDHGWNLAPFAIEEIAGLTWPGQFTLDFSAYLVLSALWVAWRHKFTPVGIGLGLVASVGGILFLAPYLLYAISQADGDVKALLLGDQGANA